MMNSITIVRPDFISAVKSNPQQGDPISLQDITQEIHKSTTTIAHALYGAIKRLIDESSVAASSRDENLDSTLNTLHQTIRTVGDQVSEQGQRLIAVERMLHELLTTVSFTTDRTNLSAEEKSMLTVPITPSVAEGTGRTNVLDYVSTKDKNWNYRFRSLEDFIGEGLLLSQASRCWTMGCYAQQSIEHPTVIIDDTPCDARTLLYSRLTGKVVDADIELIANCEQPDCLYPGHVIMSTASSPQTLAEPDLPARNESTFSFEPDEAMARAYNLSPAHGGNASPQESEEKAPYTLELEAVLPVARPKKRGRPTARSQAMNRILLSAKTFESCLKAQGLEQHDAAVLAVELSVALCLGQVPTIQGANSRHLANILADNWEGEPRILRAEMGPFHVMSALTDALHDPDQNPSINLDEVDVFLADKRFEAFLESLQRRSSDAASEKPVVAIIASSVSPRIDPRLIALGPVFTSNLYPIHPTNVDENLPFIQKRWIPLQASDLLPLDDRGQTLLDKFFRAERKPYRQLACNAYRLFMELADEPSAPPINPLESLAFGWLIPAIEASGITLDEDEETLSDAITSSPRLKARMEYATRILYS